MWPSIHIDLFFSKHKSLYNENKIKWPSKTMKDTLPGLVLEFAYNGSYAKHLRTYGYFFLYSLYKAVCIKLYCKKYSWFNSKILAIFMPV